MAGYSRTPLAKKLGIKAGHRVALLGATDTFDRGDLSPLPDDVTLLDSLRGRSLLNVILLFCLSTAQLRRRFKSAQERLVQDGGLWVCWPKKASGVATDVTEGLVRDYGLAQGLVDNKICAVDETWSGLRFVVRLVDRNHPRPG